MHLNFINNYFNLDSLAKIMIMLVLIIGAIVAKFATNYMKGDKHYQRFFINFTLLIISIILMVAADNLVIFIISWVLSNFILVKMMVHSKNWQAAQESGWLTTKFYTLGFISLLIAFILLYLATGYTSIKATINENNSSPLIKAALIFIILASITQSAIWPFHKWLISSLNSPLPVSAIMHAGLVNGGGFLITRFAPLYLNYPEILNILFIIGLTAAIMGTIWKLMQNDIKRMLACSTLAQMGFMIVQCGLGLFSAAIAHIILHGMFKAYLFLSSANIGQEKRLDLHYPPSFICFLCALVSGAVGSYSFTLISGKDWLVKDTSLLSLSIVFIAATQLAITLLRENTLIRLPLAIVITTFAGAIYGFNMHLVESMLLNLSLFKPQPLNILHISGLVLLFTLWLSIIFGHYIQGYIPFRIKMWLYVKALNASQPHPKTITAHRNKYNYV